MQLHNILHLAFAASIATAIPISPNVMSSNTMGQKENMATTQTLDDPFQYRKFSGNKLTERGTNTMTTATQEQAFPGMMLKNDKVMRDMALQDADDRRPEHMSTAFWRASKSHDNEKLKDETRKDMDMGMTRDEMKNVDMDKIMEKRDRFGWDVLRKLKKRTTSSEATNSMLLDATVASAEFGPIMQSIGKDGDDMEHDMMVNGMEKRQPSE